ncbi:MAG TPA: hypothetical protein VLZ72_05800 [Flavobacterium sp.]|nr:hypothetical protein [Flavobacterium sp.]
MRKFTYLLLTLFLSSLSAQDYIVPESFAHLKQILIEQDSNVFAFIHKDFKEKFSLTEEFENENRVEEFIGIVKPDELTKDEYLLSFTMAPSADHAFSFFKKNGDKYDYSFSILGKQIFIPGNGFIYVSGHTNNWFNKRRKYKIQEGEISEIEQPHYYVGLKSVTIRPIVLYSDKNENNEVAHLPSNSRVEVVASESQNNQEYFLIKTSFGLLGWWKLDHFYEPAINGLFFNGD